MLLFFSIILLFTFIYNISIFITAKLYGVKVKEFYIFFSINDYKLFSFKYDDTEYALGILPLGAYVKLSGMEYDDPKELTNHDFGALSLPKKNIIILSGPLSGLFLGIILSINKANMAVSSACLLVSQITLILIIGLSAVYLIKYMFKRENNQPTHSAIYGVVSFFLYLIVWSSIVKLLGQYYPISAKIWQLINGQDLKHMATHFTLSKSYWIGIFIFLINMIPFASTIGLQVITNMYEFFTGKQPYSMSLWLYFTTVTFFILLIFWLRVFWYILF